MVVVGYGQQKKLSVTGAVASIGSEDLRMTTSASLAVALAGKLPGLTSIQSAGGQPGRDDATLYLRGVATTNGAGPLILIDDVPRDNIRTLDFNEVATISILKDASATAVYGVRGANGVILITTKRGQPGKAELNLSVDQSWASFTHEPARLHSVDYMRMRNEASKNDGIVDPPFPEEVIAKYIDPLAGLDPNDPDFEAKARVRRYMYPDHDYYRELIKRFAPQTRVNLGIRGGTDKVSYFANANYLHQGATSMWNRNQSWVTTHRQKWTAGASVPTLIIRLRTPEKLPQYRQLYRAGEHAIGQRLSEQQYRLDDFRPHVPGADHHPHYSRPHRIAGLRGTGRGDHRSRLPGPFRF